MLYHLLVITHAVKASIDIFFQKYWVSVFFFLHRRHTSSRVSYLNRTFFLHRPDFLPPSPSSALRLFAVTSPTNQNAECYVPLGSIQIEKLYILLSIRDHDYIMKSNFVVSLQIRVFWLIKVLILSMCPFPQAHSMVPETACYMLSLLLSFYRLPTGRGVERKKWNGKLPGSFLLETTNQIKKSLCLILNMKRQ